MGGWRSYLSKRSGKVDCPNSPYSLTMYSITSEYIWGQVALIRDVWGNPGEPELSRVQRSGETRRLFPSLSGSVLVYYFLHLKVYTMTSSDSSRTFWDADRLSRDSNYIQ